MLKGKQKVLCSTKIMNIRSDVNTAIPVRRFPCNQTRIKDIKQEFVSSDLLLTKLNKNSLVCSKQSFIYNIISLLMEVYNK